MGSLTSLVPRMLHRLGKPAEAPASLTSYNGAGRMQSLALIKGVGGVGGRRVGWRQRVAAVRTGGP